MRSVLVITWGLLGSFGAAGVHADCREGETAQAQLACFDQLATCTAIESESSRLACFLAGGQSKASVMPSAAAAASAVPAVSAATVKPVNTGVATTNAAVEAAFPPPKSAEASEAEIEPEIHATIIALQQDARGYFYLRLDNGHVWREKESVRNRYKEGDAIVISKGALNSNQLRMVDKGRMVRVERVE